MVNDDNTGNFNGNIIGTTFLAFAYDPTRGGGGGGIDAGGNGGGGGNGQGTGGGNGGGDGRADDNGGGGGNGQGGGRGNGGGNGGGNDGGSVAVLPAATPSPLAVEPQGSVDPIVYLGVACVVVVAVLLCVCRRMCARKLPTGPAQPDGKGGLLARLIPNSKKSRAIFD